MSLFNILRLAAAATLTLAPLLSALPTGNSSFELPPIRVIAAWKGCNKDNRATLEKHFGDVVTLASYARKNFKKDHKAWTHYFRSGNEDERHVRQQWGVIEYSLSDKWAFSVLCSDGKDKQCRSGSSFAVTDAEPEEDGVPRQMKICPKYFTDPTSKRSMDYKPYNPGKRNSWCKSHPFKFDDFSVGALTLMHELSHLDTVGKLAELPEVDDPAGFKYHGTDDVTGIELDTSPTGQARELRNMWNGGGAPNLLEPYRNAESVAASALEFWVMDKCGYDNIDV